MSDMAKRVAAEVRAEMARQQLSQADLAPVLGCSRQALSRRLTGHVPFDVAELGLIAERLDVPITRFLPTAASAA